MTKIVALIPARGGSKGILRKNVRLLANIPLVAHSILIAKKCKYVDEVYVSTEDEEITRISSEFGAKVIKRPHHLATDTASSESVLLHFAEQIDFDVMIFVQCTSPLTLPSDLDNALVEYKKSKYTSMLSVTSDHGGFLCGGFTWIDNEPGYDINNRPRRQDMTNKYRENGAFYITSKEALLSSKNRLSGTIGMYIMPYERSFEIDEIRDFELLEILFKHLKLESFKPEVINKIKLVICDVDGVFTDGSVFVDQDGNELLKFSRIDGKGIELLRKAGVKIGVISAEDSPNVRKRMNKLNINDVHLGIKNKMDIYNQLKDKYSLSDDEICFCGDDIQDIEVMKIAGFTCAPSNAQTEVFKYTDYISTHEGGKGFIRDVANLVLKNT